MRKKRLRKEHNGHKSKQIGRKWHNSAFIPKIRFLHVFSCIKLIKHILLHEEKHLTIALKCCF